MAINNTLKFNNKPISPAFKSAVAPYRINSTSGNLQLKGTAQQPVAKPTQSVYSAPVQSSSQQTIKPPAISTPVNTQSTQTTTQPTTKPTKGLVAPSAPTYSSLITNLSNASRPTNTQTGLVQDLRNTAQGNKEIADNARRISEQYGTEISRVGQLGAGAVAGNLSTGSNVVGSGNAAIASQSSTSRMNALAQAQDAALKGTAQQLTAQEQTAGAFNQALGGANTQQSQLLGGLNSAGNLAQPVQVPYGNQFLSPATGQSAGGAGLGGYAGYNAGTTSYTRLSKLSKINVWRSWTK